MAASFFCAKPEHCLVSGMLPAAQALHSWLRWLAGATVWCIRAGVGEVRVGVKSCAPLHPRGAQLFAFPGPRRQGVNANPAGGVSDRHH